MRANLVRTALPLDIYAPPDITMPNGLASVIKANLFPDASQPGMAFKTGMCLIQAVRCFVARRPYAFTFDAAVR
jgi:hypothetical protein